MMEELAKKAKNTKKVAIKPEEEINGKGINEYALNELEMNENLFNRSSLS